MSETPKLDSQSGAAPDPTITPLAVGKKSFPANHTPEPWYLHEYRANNFPLAICTNAMDPDVFPHVIVMFTGACRRRPIDYTIKELRANAELLLRAPRLLAMLRTIVAELANTCVSDVESGDAVCVSRDPARRLLEELQKAGVF